MTDGTVEYFDDQKAKSDLAEGVSLISDDPNTMELDTEPFLERIYNEILGNSKNGDTGTWVRDDNRVRIMNELGASTFVHEVSSRFSVHTNFSDLSNEEIRLLVTWACDAFADNLEDNYISWSVNPSFGNLMSVSERLYSILLITLNIAKNAGMRKHRERSKNPHRLLMEQKQMVDGGMVI